MNTRTLCRKIAAEGAVLLKNEHRILPLAKGTKLAVFGRAQTFYYKSGTGSGGLVNIDKEPCMIESMKSNADLVLDETLIALYADWVAAHPFEDGGGKWATEPWFQEEMPLDEDIVKAAAERNDAAVVLIARTAGEDHDNADEEGSYRLTAKEEQLLTFVTRHFGCVIVALNVGNLIDTSFTERYPVSALLYIWQGGMEGANAFADLLSGKAAPSGKLTDTVARKLSDYPSDNNFGNREKNIYAEDIYVGYRYFETFSKDAVRYPFGYGLTYTDFDIGYTAHEVSGTITVSARVTNIGDHVGKEVVQVYYKAPCGQLGTPERQLIAFAKTKELKPGESENLDLSFSVLDMASYDDGGVTGHRSCYVLEQGDYEIVVGTDVRSAQAIFTYTVNKLTVVKSLEEILPPVQVFSRLCAAEENGKRKMIYRRVPASILDVNRRITNRRPSEIAYTGNKGIHLKDVYDQTHTLDEFIAQLSDHDLAALCCGEGMNSPKATPGTGGALGGQTESLSHFGIPVCCVTDGPSGIRLDTGDKATSIPNGILLACTWDTALVEELYTHIGEELKWYHIDALLGPGINLHRHPLCGRNFEYFSEDPHLTGKIAVAVTKGSAKSGTFSTVKHFCCNNQETNRYGCETVVSERALRELYLKPFEITVKEGENVLVMTAYNPVNGYWTASSYDLTMTVLRDEWGFDGFVMTDWWAKCNTECHAEGSGELLQAMVRASNDVYMVCTDADIKAQSILEGLKQGFITRGELQRCAKHIGNWILRTNTFRDYVANGCVPKYPIVRNGDDMKNVAEIMTPIPEKDYAVALHTGLTVMEFLLLCDADVLAQTPVTVRCGERCITFCVCGTQGEYISVKRCMDMVNDGVYPISVIHPDSVKIQTIIIKQ